jgi:hypothetical protein
LKGGEVLPGFTLMLEKLAYGFLPYNI